ncbi:MAG: ribosome-associated translation inhibitor RaiA [Rickettsiales bacterium]|nr:ribosome-associated translation inhibitor RaiA [Rickettsiales bacterium]
MQINISGKNMDLGEAFQNHVEARLEEGISKYLDRVQIIEVVATKEGHLVRVDIHGNTGTHSQLMINSRAEAGDIYAAFDQAADKVEKQLRRYKRRITNHHKTRQSNEDVQLTQAKHYTLAPEAGEELEEEAKPIIIAESPTNVETLTVSEAVMRMDLADLPALMFYNSAHGRVNVIYRRPDGNIAWVDPEEVAAAA